MRVMRILLMVIAVLATTLTSLSAPLVPAEFQDLYGELYVALSRFRNTMAQSWDGSRAPVVFSANVMSASAARGPALLAPAYTDGVLLEIDSLKALGARAVTLQIGFPMLHPPFHQSEEEYQQYLGFYSGLAQEIRARGLTLIVETQALFTEGGFTWGDVAPYYAGLTLAQYRQGRMEVARTIALHLRPDYLSVIQEPDTEAEQTAKFELGTVGGSRALLDTILGGLQAADVEGVAVGAGVGTWQEDYRAYVESFVSTSIDFVDMHIYAVNRDFLPRALEIADVAASHGKPVGMTETWLYKARDDEQDVLDFTTVFGRDVFSFWAPIDALHLRAMVELAHFKRFAFMSPFWSGYFHGYVGFDDSTKHLTSAELDVLAQAEQAANLLKGVYSTSAFWYKNAIVVPSDVTPPDAPTDLAAQLASPTSVALTWSPAADNVGTAAYLVFRDRVRVTQTATTYFVDSGLSEARQYVYSVVAFDASIKASPAASVAISTPDTTPPSVPADLAAIAMLAGPQITIDLSWSPSIDNVGVAQYRLYWGTSPDSLSVVAAPTATSYTIANAPPETTYYFAVSAVDAAWNDSGQATGAVTTPAIPDTTSPVVIVGYPTEGATISGTTYLYAAAYDVRGGSYDAPSGMAAVQFQIDGVAVGVEQTVPYSELTDHSVYRLQVDAMTLAEGEHLITAVARDQAGNVATSAAVRVTVTRKAWRR